MQSRSLFPLLALLAPPVIASAQVAKDTARIAPVVVTATRSPLAADRAPASVSVISGEQLRREGITLVLDALRQVPGVSVVQTGSYGGQTSLFIRGGESKFAKVLVDGVPVNDAGGAFDFSTLSTDNLDRIEIVRGPASVLYGSDAMAGVVQLFTRPGAGQPQVELSGRGGGYASYDADAAVRGSTSLLSYSLAGARHSTDGIQAFNSQYRQQVASALFGAHHDAVDAHLSFRYSDNAVHYPTDGSGQVVDSNAMHRDDRLAAGLDAGYRFSPTAELRLSLATYDVHGLSDDQPDSPGDSNGYYFSTGDRSRRRSGDLRLNVDLPAAMRLTVGAQVENEWQASETQSNFGPSAFTARRRTRGAYGQWLFAPSDPYTLTVGGRYEHNEEFGDFLTYRAAGSAQLASTRVRASVGTAFREPTFLENFGGPFVIGNAKLTPEHALSFDAGVEQIFGDRGTIGITAFANSFRDLIDYAYSATAPNYNNIARTRTSGTELEGRGHVQRDARDPELHENVYRRLLRRKPCAQLHQPQAGTRPHAVGAARAEDARNRDRPVAALLVRLRRGFSGRGAGLERCDRHRGCRALCDAGIQPIDPGRVEERDRLGKPAVGNELVRAQTVGGDWHLAGQDRDGRSAAAFAEYSLLLQLAADERDRSLYPIFSWSR
jgi:vitamin B12 transporter